MRDIFWVVGFALLASWIIAVTFTPFLGVQMLPEIKALPGGHQAIYATPGYAKLRRVITWAVRRKALVACIVLGIAAVGANPNTHCSVVVKGRQPRIFGCLFPHEPEAASIHIWRPRLRLAANCFSVRTPASRSTANPWRRAQSVREASLARFSG